MYIHDQRKPPTCHFSQLNQGDLFAWEDGDDLFYLMVMDDDNVAARQWCLAQKNATLILLALFGLSKLKMKFNLSREN